jgi:hypothetical protein
MDVYYYNNQHELLKGVNEILSMNAGMMEIKIYVSSWELVIRVWVIHKITE